jgi:hypothetical protein
VKTVSPHPEAEAEFDEAEDFYEDRAPGLGVRFRNAVEHAVQRIQL